MEAENRENAKRDYDKNPIVIKDYGAYFQASFLMLLIPLLVILWIEDFKNGRFQNINIYSFEFIRFLVSVLFCFWFFYYLFKLSSRFQSTPSKFIFYNSCIIHTRYIYDGSKYKDEIVAPLKIKEVSFCIVTELTFRYGRLHYLTSWQLYRKSSIGVHIGKTVLYIRFLLTYIFFILPYKIYRLTKAKEPYWLLKKNLFIHFDNRNYFLVNIYSRKELDELLKYFEAHDIPIKSKTVLIPQAQNDGPFKDKNEIWANKFDNKGEKS
jgi:hypothetical protein